MTDRPVAIVTGASSGIGMEAALEFARRGYAVALAARRQDRLAEVARKCQGAGGGRVLVVSTDVADRRQVEALVARTADQFGRVDVMVNNAGYGHFARVLETTDRDMHALFAANFFGVFYGCRAVAPVMIRQGGGHIFNVSSIVGKRGAPFHGAYSASKFAIMGLSDCLRVEMMPHNVRVTAVCPALTDTEFFQHSSRGRRARSSFERFRRLMPASAVARRMAAAVGKNKPELVFTFGGRLLVVINTLWPRLADRIMKLYHDDLARSLGQE